MEFAMIQTGWWSILPPIIAIVLALITKEVYSSLFIGLFSGVLIYAFAGGGGIVKAASTAFDMMFSKISGNAYTLPLHSSQLELRRNDEYSLFSVRVRPTFDFKQKILSMGSSIEVVKPESFRKEMREEIEAMMRNYKEEEAP